MTGSESVEWQFGPVRSENNFTFCLIESQQNKLKEIIFALANKNKKVSEHTRKNPWLNKNISVGSGGCFMYFLSLRDLPSNQPWLYNPCAFTNFKLGAPISFGFLNESNSIPSVCI
jgi:hypothetical protein